MHRDIDKEDKTFFTGLPQTQSELEELSIDSADYQMKAFITDLFMRRNLSKDKAMQRILKFFEAYDCSRDMNILVLQKQVQAMKKSNQKLRNNQAFDNAEKAEIENLFLDCIEQCKREQYKKDNQNRANFIAHARRGSTASSAHGK